MAQSRLLLLDGCIAISQYPPAKANQRTLIS
jgi:hypothetical protein